jgi:hypothetical protein
MRGGWLRDTGLLPGAGWSTVAGSLASAGVIALLVAGCGQQQNAPVLDAAIAASTATASPAAAAPESPSASLSASLPGPASPSPSPKTSPLAAAIPSPYAADSPAAGATTDPPPGAAAAPAVGTAANPPANPPVGAATPAASPEASPSAGGKRHGEACSAAGLVITDADNGRTLCARPGTAVIVLLTHASGVQVAGPLTPRPDILPMLVQGTTGASFAAGRPGVATITSVIAPCGSGPGVHCMLLMLFRVTVDIKAR